MFKYIIFPLSDGEQQRILSDVAKGYPGIIGIIDGTQISLTAVPRNIDMVYMYKPKRLS